MALRANDYQLKDLADGAPLLIEASSGKDTGVTLTRCIGAGGNSTVFLAECDPIRRSDDLSPLSPRRLAVKIMQPRSAKTLERGGVDPASIFVRESVALGRMMERQPPSEFVVGFYGSGLVEVQLGGSEVHRLPWLAIDFIDGGKMGTSLTQRVKSAPEGVDPLRARRMVWGIIEGVRALHSQGILHRDLKPDNVLVAGPIDTETVKLADCGIARIEGMNSTVQGMTLTYGGPEQTLSRPGESCPVIGPWTDVHGLAATIWFVIAGEDWCRGTRDVEWFRGARRSLATAKRLHPAFKLDASVLMRLDAALSRGAAQRLPEAAWQAPDTTTYKQAAAALLPGMFKGAERSADVDTFATDLMPLLHEVAEKWTALAAEEDFAATAFRPSSNLPVDSDRARQKIATVRSFSAMNGTDIERAHWLDPILAGATSSFSFRHDGKVLARFHDRLFYLDFVDGAPFPVGVPSKRIALVGESRWMVPAPMGGFALIGPTHLLMLRQGLFTAMATPDRPGGGDVGAICSVMGDGGVFGLVTTPVPGVTEHPELWTSFDAIQWSRPQPLPMDGTVNSIAYGPFGYIAVGASPQENGRAIFMGFDGRVHSYEKGVVERPPLLVATCGTHTTAWTAGEGFILRLDREGVAAEPLEVHETPVAMKLDLVGIPWLLTTHTVLRRHLEGGKPVWRVYHRVETNLPAQTAFGFNTRGVCVFDRYGDGVLITPFDIEDWSEVETWSRESSRG